MAEDNVTQFLRAVNSGSNEAYGDLLQLVYAELRSLAGALMRRERGYRTLQPTALVHEAYLRLALPEPRWESRAHFFGAAAQAMRRILVEHARRRLSHKRGGGLKRITFQDLDVRAEDLQFDLIALNEALTALGEVDQRLVRVVELRYFAGCSLEETAELLDLAPATVKRDWAYARAWLLERLR
jgi:RNA polymerase sigma factor (TIGR02999 family)